MQTQEDLRTTDVIESYLVENIEKPTAHHSQHKRTSCYWCVHAD